MARLQGDIDRMVEALGLLRRALPEFERRNRLAAGADGYPGSSMGGGGSGGIGRPTERAALTRPPADPVRTWTREAVEALESAARSIATAESRRRLVLDSGGLSGQAEPDRACENPSCGTLTREPLRDGRCPACYQWRRRNGGAERSGRRVSA